MHLRVLNSEWLKAWKSESMCERESDAALDYESSYYQDRDQGYVYG